MLPVKPVKKKLENVCVLQATKSTKILWAIV